MRLFWIFLGLALLFLIPFLIWGGSMEQAFSSEAAITWLTRYDEWAWFAGIALLMLDFLLPVPGTAVMAALGYVYGAVKGGLIASSGSFLSGLVAYSVCRFVGPNAARKLLGEKDYQRGMNLFAKTGGWIVAASRCFPLLPEVVACMAGLTRMPFTRFALALACGSIPLGFIFAYVGSTGIENPKFAILLSAAIPPVLWLLAHRLIISKPTD